MMMAVLNELGPWNWWVLGLLLLGLEILMPGTFFLWFGLSAIVVGTITLALGPENAVWVWQFQVLVFLVLALLSAYFGRKAMARYGWDKSENETLNNRGEQLLGKTVTLKDPIADGSGRAKIGDTVWRVSGPDLEAGRRVRVVGHKAGTLIANVQGGNAFAVQAQFSLHQYT